MGGAGDVLGGVGGLIGGGIGLATAPDGGDKFRKKAIEVFERLKESKWDEHAVSPAELQILAEYMPQMYQAVLPRMAETAADSQAGRGAQLEGIGYLSRIRDKGLPVETRLAVEEAQRGVSNAAQGAQNAVLENFAARGRLGGGAELAARVGANQQAMETAQGMGSDLARQVMERRMQAATGAAGLGATERGQTIGLNQGNASNLNRYNEMAAQILNEMAQRNAASAERAGFANTENRQRVGESNELNRVEAERRNQEYLNQLKAMTFDQQYRRAGGMAQGYGALAGARDAARAAYIANAQGLGQATGKTVGGIVDIVKGGGVGGGIG